MATVIQWIGGARPQTLTTAISPVTIGSACAWVVGGFKAVNALLALAVALCLQIGVNYANDYSDGIRGTDDYRVGPERLTANNRAMARQVRRAAFAFLGVGSALGLTLVIISESWWFILIGLGCIIAAWGYTGGKNPYGYRGFGEIFVFVFFGLIATLGTLYTQIGTITFAGIIGAVSAGLFASALLITNNVRDIVQDRRAGKHTLAVYLGDKKSRLLYVGTIGAAILLPLTLAPSFSWMTAIIAVIPFTLIPSYLMLTGMNRRTLVVVLKQTSLVTFIFALIYSAALVLSVIQF